MHYFSKIRKLVKDADAILITAGAGMGVDSGLPDFRGIAGFWNEYPIAKQLGLEFKDIANPKTLLSNPKLGWAFYGSRFNRYKNTQPHIGFNLLLDLVIEKNNNYFVYTSNVDGQFQKVGFDEKKIVECHGRISHAQCSYNCKNESWKLFEDFEIDMTVFESNTIPLCPHCGVIARPNILLFEDWHWNKIKSLNQENNFEIWKKENIGKNILVIEIGAGLDIPTIREISENTARILNGSIIRINPFDYEINPLAKNSFSVPLGAAEGLSKILKPNYGYAKVISLGLSLKKCFKL